MRTRTLVTAFALIMIIGYGGGALAQDPVPPTGSLEDAFPPQKHFSPYAGRNFPTQVFWGDTHLHTGMSMDAGAFGARLGAGEDAYRFARGEELTSSTGLSRSSSPAARLPGRGRPLGQHGLLPAAVRGATRRCWPTRPGEALVRHGPGRWPERA